MNELLTTYGDASGYGLIGISVLVRWEAARIRMAKLTAGSGTPRI